MLYNTTEHGAVITTIVNGSVLDTGRMEFVGERHLTLEGDRVVGIDTARPTVEADRVLDARDRYVMPGFIDGHVHHVITTMDSPRLMRLTPVERALGMGRLAEATGLRGFATVRDTGGDTMGLVSAISQTGGHGDFAPSDTGAICACEIHSNELSHVAGNGRDRSPTQLHDLTPINPR